MKQGSTFVLVVDLQLDMSYVKSIIFTLKNKGKILTKENWSFEDGKFKIPFTQEETVQLEGRTLIEAQINFEDGNVAKSEIKEIFIKESLATSIVEGNKATEETQEIGLAIAGDVVYTDGVGGGDYKLPIATESTLGGVKPLNKTKEMTQEVGVDKDGRLFAKIKDTTVDSELDEESTNPIQNKVITAEVIALRERNAELEETIEKLQIKTTTSPSPFHHITDSANMKVVDFGMEGKTEQKTVAGNNIWNPHSDYTNGTYRYWKVKDDDSQSMTITLYDKNTNIDITGLSLMVSDTGDYGSNVIGLIDSSGYVRHTTLTTTYNYIAIYRPTDEVLTTLLARYDIMVNIGDKSLPYEEFVGRMPSPNPDYKQEIKNAGVYNEETGRYEIGCSFGNKNWFSMDMLVDGVILDGMGNFGNKEGYCATEPLKLKNGQWTFSCQNTENNVVLVTFDSSGVRVTTPLNGKISSKTFTISDDVEYIIFGVHTSKENVENMNIQFEYNGSQTTCTPHASQPFTLTSPVPLTKWDKLVKRDGKWYWDYKQLKLVVDGKSGWQIYGGRKGFYVSGKLPFSDTGRKGFCNSLRVDNSNSKKNIITLGLSNSIIYATHILFYDENLEDYGLANWKAHLNEHPLEIYTYKNESELVPLPDEEQTLLKNLETYYGVTNVYNEQGCPMWLTYVNDTKLYVDKKLLEIQQAII